MFLSARLERNPRVVPTLVSVRRVLGGSEPFFLHLDWFVLTPFSNDATNLFAQDRYYSFVLSAWDCASLAFVQGFNVRLGTLETLFYACLDLQFDVFLAKLLLLHLFPSSSLRDPLAVLLVFQLDLSSSLLRWLAHRFRVAPRLLQHRDQSGIRRVVPKDFPKET